MSSKSLFLLLLIASIFTSFFYIIPSSAHPQTALSDLTVYDDALSTDWANWSWSSTADFSEAGTVQGGSSAIAVTYTDAWAGFFLHSNSNINSSSYSTLRFWIHGGGTGGQAINLLLYDDAGTPQTPVAITATANSWTEVEITLAALGNPALISGLVWQDGSGGAQPTFYLDQIQLIAPGVPPTPTPTAAPIAGPALAIDYSQESHAIDPNIYGMNFADDSLAAALDLPINRWGGNATTRYNWQVDVSNRASDWYFENIPNNPADPSLLPIGSSSDSFISQNQSRNTETLLTIPMIGWTPKDRAGISCGFSVSKYGASQSSDPWRSDCGDGVQLDGTFITGNDPLDTSVAISESFVISWMAHLADQHGTATNGGVRFYNLDNEPMLWHSTHRDIHPNPVGYDEIRALTYRYGAAIKETDPAAQLLGPTLWGWTAYDYSALDMAAGGAWWSNPIDRNAHGGTPFVEWYLQEMAAYETITGTRLLDYLDLHYYPQAATANGNISLQPAGDAEQQALRLRSTRALWDPTYVDESWINQSVQLIPRMHSWVDSHYPGTKLALTEYNWGGLEDINGALAQADILGIFGREGLDLATLWSPPSPTEPGAFAFQLYRNYDGAKGKFGDTSLSATSTDQSQLALYAAKRSSDEALTIMVINKISQTLISPLTLSGITPQSTAQVYRYSDANLNAIVHEAPQAINQGRSGGFTGTFPPNSITLFVVTPEPPAYTITKIRNTPDPMRLGDEVGFTIQISNTGPYTLTTIPLTDTYNTAYLIFVTATVSPDTTADDGQLNWQDLTSPSPNGFGIGLMPGASFNLVVTFTAQQDTSLLPGGATTNIANLYSQSASATVQILNSTAVQLMNTSLTWFDGAVKIQWETVDESLIIGFMLYRQQGEGEFMQLTDEPIIAKQAMQAAGSGYQFKDEQIVDNRSYRYRLEILRFDTVQFVDIGSISTGFELFLPVIKPPF